MDDSPKEECSRMSLNPSPSRTDSAESEDSASLSDDQISPEDVRSNLPRRIKTKSSGWSGAQRGEIRGFLVTSRKRDQHRIFPTPILSGMRNPKECEIADDPYNPEHWLERQLSKKPKIDSQECQVDWIPDFESGGESTEQDKPSQEKYSQDELDDFLDFCKFISSDWTPELNGPLLKGARVSSSGCRERALQILNSCDGNIILAKFRIMFPMAELVEPSILQKLSAQDLARTVADGERKFREEKETAKEVLINEMSRMVKNRIKEGQLKDFLQEHELEEHEMPQEVTSELNQAHQMTLKIEDLPASGISMDEAQVLIDQSRAVRVVSKTMEDFESEWNRSVILAQKIKELNSGAVTLRGIQSILKEKKNLQIQIEGAPELKAALARAQKWFTRASAFFKRPKPRSSQTLIPSSYLAQDGVQEPMSLVRAEGSSTLDELIDEAATLELQCLDVVKTQKELLSLRAWERRVRMILEDPKEQCRQDTLESLVEEGQQMKGQIPLLEQLLKLQDRVKWEQKSELLLSSKGTKLKKLESLLDEGEQKTHSPILLQKLRDLHKEILHLQERVTEVLAQCNDRRGKATYEELSELMEKCEELPVNVPAKHALGRKIHELDNWVRKARLALGGTREAAKLNQLKQLLEEWTEIRVSVKEEQHLRSLVFPTQGFIERMKKCVRKYEKQASILSSNKPHATDLAPMSLQSLVAFERRPCAYEECVGLIEEAPEIVKQDQEYQSLRDLIQQAVEWEKEMLSLFEQRPIPDDIRERLLHYRRVPAKRSVVSHLMRLYLVHEWKAKVLKVAGSAPFNILKVLLEEGKQLTSDTTRSYIELEFKNLEEKVQRLQEWMQLKSELQNEVEE